jgi:putative SOS response-associated peptidase YedK
MCGYIKVNGEHQRSFMQFSKQKIVKQFYSTSFKRYYPSFGQDPNKTIDIVIEENGVLNQVAATWWFDCSDSFEGLHVGTRTTFNARNLDSSYWQGALQYNRAIILGTGIGESKVVGKKSINTIWKAMTSLYLARCTVNSATIDIAVLSSLEMHIPKWSLIIIKPSHAFYLIMTNFYNVGWVS